MKTNIVQHEHQSLNDIVDSLAKEARYKSLPFDKQVELAVTNGLGYEVKTDYRAELLYIMTILPEQDLLKNTELGLNAHIKHMDTVTDRNCLRRYQKRSPPY